MPDTAFYVDALVSLVLNHDMPIDEAVWKDVQAHALVVQGLNAEGAVTEAPDNEVLMRMACAFDPVFGMSPDELGPDVVGPSDRDRRQLLDRMARVYRAAHGLEVKAPEQAAGEPRLLQQRDWWRHLDHEGQARLLAKFADVSDDHWRVAAQEIGRFVPNVPVVARNERIGPILVEKGGLAHGREGLYPCFGGLRADDGMGWYIPDEALDRWSVVPFPRSARGWYELFGGGGDHFLVNLRDVHEEMVGAVDAHGGSSPEAQFALDRFLAALESLRATKS